MYQKRPGVFMADWWDADGRRHRKQFSNSAAAREHEHRETALAHAERASREMKLAARTGGVKRSPKKADSGTMEPAKGKLGVMIPGMGAVATTFVAGVEDIREFRKSSGASRLITMWCGSTESYIEPTEAHQSVKAFEKALRENDEMIAPSMMYAYASLMEGVPFANGAPNLTVDLPVMLELSRKNEAPICGKDFKTGQTLMKTVLAPAFKARLLGLSGWYSTNILGNRDGEVLEDPGSFKTK